MVAQTGCFHTEGIAWVRSLATRPVVARVGNLGPDVHVRVHASDAVNVLLTRRGQLDFQVQGLIEHLTNLSPSPMKKVKWAPQKVAQNESRGVLLSEHALHEENGFARKGCYPAGKKLVNLILVLRLNHHGGIWQLFDDGFLERLILKILFDEGFLGRLILKSLKIEKIGLR